LKSKQHKPTNQKSKGETPITGYVIECKVTGKKGYQPDYEVIIIGIGSDTAALDVFKTMDDYVKKTKRATNEIPGKQGI
jgi:hypothetical protein